MLEGLNFGQIVQLVFGNTWVKAVLGLLVLDVGAGLAVSLRAGEFRLAEVANFLLTKVVPYLIGAGSLQVALYAVPTAFLFGYDSAAHTVVWGFVLLAMAGHAFDNFRQLGLPVPPVLGAKEKIETTATP